MSIYILNLTRPLLLSHVNTDFALSPTYTTNSLKHFSRRDRTMCNNVSCIRSCQKTIPRDREHVRCTAQQRGTASSCHTCVIRRPRQPSSRRRAYFGNAHAPDTWLGIFIVCVCVCSVVLTVGRYVLLFDRQTAVLNLSR